MLLKSIFFLDKDSLFRYLSFLHDYTYTEKKIIVGDYMPAIITGVHGAAYIGFPAPSFGPWNQLIHQSPYTINLGHQTIYLEPALYGHPGAFPYLGPYVPFRLSNRAFNVNLFACEIPEAKCRLFLETYG
jgi:hypothetical protein